MFQNQSTQLKINNRRALILKLSLGIINYYIFSTQRKLVFGPNTFTNMPKFLLLKWKTRLKIIIQHIKLH